MSETARDPNNLGAATEALLGKAFAERALISAPPAAKILGMDPSDLRELACAGRIPSAIVGAGATRKALRFAEIDLRRWIVGIRTGEAKAEPVGRVTVKRSPDVRKVYDISEIRAQRKRR